MIKYLFTVLLVCTWVIINSCVKDPLKGSGKATAEWNGEKWEGRVSFYESKLGDTSLLIYLRRYNDNDIYNPAETILFYAAKRNGNRQQLIDTVDEHSNHPYFRVSINDSYDATKGRFRLVMSDSVNNYLRLISEKDDYTNKVVGEFSATVVKVDNNPRIADYPDTIRIRNGRFETKRIDE